MIIWLATAQLRQAPRLLAAGDGFFLVYMAAIAFVIARTTPEELRQRASIDDEGIFLVIIISLGVIAVSIVAIVMVLNQKDDRVPLDLALAAIGVPLGWFTLHTIAAFHYADLYYARKENGPQSRRGLTFPDIKEPGVWEFLYYSFTIGMTAQTSDTNVHDTNIRRATLGHSVVSFFYNTAIIAMSVNAVIAVAS